MRTEYSDEKVQVKIQGKNIGTCNFLMHEMSAHALAFTFHALLKTAYIHKGDYSYQVNLDTFVGNMVDDVFRKDGTAGFLWCNYADIELDEKVIDSIFNLTFTTYTKYFGGMPCNNTAYRMYLHGGAKQIDFNSFSMDVVMKCFAKALSQLPNSRKFHSTEELIKYISDLIRDETYKSRIKIQWADNPCLITFNNEEAILRYLNDTDLIHELVLER